MAVHIKFFTIIKVYRCIKLYFSLSLSQIMIYLLVK